MTAAAFQTFPVRFRDELIFGDCVQRIRALPGRCVDLVVTDPPYLAKFKDRTGRTLMNDDQADWLKPAFAEIYRVLRPGRFAVCFYGWPKLDRFFEAWRAAGFRPVGHFVTLKPYASGRRFVEYRHEQAFLLAKGEPALPAKPISDVLPWLYTGNRWHPTEKPLCTLSPLIEAFSAPGDLVFDPFAGSASTLLAAARLGRHYCGIELDPKYHALARRRLFTFKRHAPTAA